MTAAEEDKAAAQREQQQEAFAAAKEELLAYIKKAAEDVRGETEAQLAKGREESTAAVHAAAEEQKAELQAVLKEEREAASASLRQAIEAERANSEVGVFFLSFSCFVGFDDEAAPIVSSSHPTSTSTSTNEHAVLICRSASRQHWPSLRPQSPMLSRAARTRSKPLSKPPATPKPHAWR